MVQEFEVVTDENYTLRPGVDQVRCRSYDDHAGHWREWTEWRTIKAARTIGGFLDSAGEPSLAQEWQFRRPLHVETQPQVDDEFEPLPIEDGTVTQPGRDQGRYRCYGGTWSQWLEIEGKPAPVVAYIAEMPAHYEWQFRRRKPAAQEPQPQPPEPEQPATVDRGERYQRRIYQSIDGPGKGSSIVVDLADVLGAFDVPYMLGQAVKKSILPGNRGAKDRLKDLREAAWSIQRQIQIEESRAQDDGPVSENSRNSGD